LKTHAVGNGEGNRSRFYD